jgi:hypothetical protein
MATYWTGDLIAFVVGDNQFVSLAVPSADARIVGYFRASGPMPPISWPQPTPVASIMEWLREKSKAGYHFA